MPTSTIEIQETPADRAYLIGNRYNLAVARSIITANTTICNTIFAGPMTAPRVRVSWSDTTGINFVLGRPAGGEKLCLSGTWQAVSLGEGYKLDKYGIWVANVGDPENKPGCMNVRNEFRADVHVVVGTQEQSTGMWSPMFFSTSPLGLGACAAYQPSKQVQLWYGNNQTSGAAIAEQQTPVQKHEVAGTEPHYFHFDTKAGVWLEQMTERSKRDLTKRFDEMDVDWFLVERQLSQWSESFRAGKKLRVDVTFNYVELGQPAPVASKRGGKRGYPSATLQMLAERDSQVDAEGGTSSQPSIWQDVYNLMRCTGPPCNLGPHCWRDPFGKKHYKLRTHQLKALIRHVQQGGQLQSHDDVPEDVRQQLYAEEQQQLERHRRTSHNVSAGQAPIHITNVLPGPSHSTSMTAEVQAKPRLDVPGFLDAAVEDYSNWQQSRVMREDQKDDIRNMCDIALEHGLDLQQLYDDQDPDFFISRGIKLGVARRFNHNRVKRFGLGLLVASRFHTTSAIDGSEEKNMQSQKSSTVIPACLKWPLALSCLPPTISTHHSRKPSNPCGVVSFVHLFAKNYFTVGNGWGVFDGPSAEEQRRLAEHLLEAMNSMLRKDMCGLQKPGARVHNVSTKGCVKNSRLPHSAYACEHWVKHVQAGGRSCSSLMADGGKVHSFFQKQLLHWLEAMALLQKVLEAIVALQKLEVVLQAGDVLAELQHDADHRIYKGAESTTMLNVVHDALRTEHRAAAVCAGGAQGSASEVWARQRVGRSAADARGPYWPCQQRGVLGSRRSTGIRFMGSHGAGVGGAERTAAAHVRASRLHRQLDLL
ncbi:hypothetical protein OPT61_g8114 [Boeremia exigua]|uniref:Uncharacterized protein n=1 Tax=Boeremia exigua TaxID=749465 RepID=A0ACC2I198_9PLEO|nr:hypothetical protein OPT61_g8114 [Boeremia exigua]